MSDSTRFNNAQCPTCEHRPMKKQIVVPELVEWIGLNLLERDDEL